MISPALWAQRVKLQHLRVVLAVAQNRSLVKAAEQVGLTQPALTRIIHELETDLGVPLFSRTSRGTHCTAYGELLADHARLVLAQLEQAASDLHDAREGLAGRVVVGALIAGAADILPRAIAQLHEELPGLRVTLIEGTYDYLIPLLRQGAIDLIVGRLPAHTYRDGMEVERFYQEEIALVVRPEHPALTLPAPSLAELRQWPWILPLPDTTLRRILETAFHELHLDLPDAPCESVSLVSNRRLLRETDWICAFPARVIAADIQCGQLSRVPFKPQLRFGPVGVTHRKATPLSRPAERLLTVLRKVSKSTPDYP